MIKNQRGFALTLCLSLLPLFFSFFILIFTVLEFTRLDLNHKYICRSQGLMAQKTVAPLLKGLLDLNPLSTSLKLQYEAAKAELAAATASLNFFAEARALRKIARITMQRKSLDLKQKTIREKAQSLLKKSFHQTKKNISNAKGLLITPLFLLTTRTSDSKEPKFAVRPKSSDIAPNYEPLPDFEVAQSLVHRWQYKVTMKKPFSTFLQGTFSSEKACAVSLIQENQEWRPQIVEAKLSLKSLW